MVQVHQEKKKHLEVFWCLFFWFLYFLFVWYLYDLRLMDFLFLIKNSKIHMCNVPTISYNLDTLNIQLSSHKSDFICSGLKIHTWKWHIKFCLWTKCCLCLNISILWPSHLGSLPLNFSIQKQHGVVTNKGGIVKIKSIDGKILVNGAKITKETEIHHNDR